MRNTLFRAKKIVWRAAPADRQSVGLLGYHDMAIGHNVIAAAIVLLYLRFILTRMSRTRPGRNNDGM